MSLNIENKYYTPIMDEFSINFEYETRAINKESLKEVWKHTRIDLNEEVLRVRDLDEGKTVSFLNPMEFIYYNLRNGNIRVKYLDSEDIESLGWEFKYGREDKERTMFEKIVKRTDSRAPNGMKYNLLHVPSTNWVLIYNVQIEFKTVMGFEKMKNTEEPKTVFAGKIKNKSELKTLMEWLQID